MIGKTLGHYRITDQLGKGGMGEVFQARDTKLSRDVAIKILPQKRSAEGEYRARFRREARTLATLQHENIASIYGLEKEDDIHFLVMELVEGEDLSHRLKSGGIAVEEVIDLAGQLAEGLAAAHAVGVAHRDLKPANLRITPEGKLKILDFGLARSYTEGEVSASDLEDEPTMTLLTEERAIIGTAGYMSPEQARGKRVDHRTDIWAFGVVLFEMLSGRPVFEGETPSDVIAAVLRADLPWDCLPKTTPRVMRRLLERCLDRDPSHRLQAIAEARIALRDLQTGRHDAGPGFIPHGFWGRPAGRLSVLGLIVALVASALWLFNPSGSGIVAPGGAQGAVAVMGFENLSDPSDADHLGRIMAGLLHTDLAESGGLRMVTRSQVLASLKEAGAVSGGFDASVATEAARAAEAKIMIVGQVIRNGEQVILTAEISDVASGNSLASIRQATPEQDRILALAEDIADEVRSRLGVANDTQANGGFSLARSLTDSPAAYRFYAAGELALNNLDWYGAIEHFSRAVRVDSTFALAYYRWAQAVRWYFRGEDDPAALLDKGLAHAQDLPPRWLQLMQAYRVYLDNDFDGAYSRLMPLIDANTDLPDVYYLMGEVTFHGSRYRDYTRSRESLEKALELDPSYHLVLPHIIEAYLFENDATGLAQRVDAIREHGDLTTNVAFGECALLMAQGKRQRFLERFRQLEQEGVKLDYLVFQLLPATRDWSTVSNVAAELLQQEGTNPQFYGSQLRGLERVFKGRLQAGLQDFEKLIQLADDDGEVFADIAAHGRSVRSLLLWMAGDVEGSLASAPHIQSDPYEPEIYYRLGALLFRAGRMDEGRSVLIDLRTMSARSFSPRTPFWLFMLEAEERLTRGQPTSALAALEECRRMASAQRNRRLESLLYARVLAAAGQNEAARDAYREFLEPAYLLDVKQVILVEEIPALYELARLEEATGDLQQAEKHYAAYLEHWGAADLPISSVSDARARLQAIRARP